MTRDELLDLAEREVTTDLPTAGRAYGIGRTLSFELHRRGEFPVPVLQLGGKFRVSTHVLLESLGLGPPHDDEGPPAGDPVA